MKEGTVFASRMTRVRSPFSSLLRTQLKVAYGPRGLSDKLGLGRSKYAYVYVALLVLAFIPLIGQLYSAGKAMAAQFVAIGQPGLSVLTSVAAGQFIVFFLGVSSVMSVLYYENDIETLLALPLRPAQIMVAKVVVTYLAELLMAAVLAGPFLVALGVQLHIPEFWPYMVLVLLSVPAVPLALSLLATVVIMRSTRSSRMRDNLRVALGLIFFALVICLNYLNTSITVKGPEEAARLLMERNGLIRAASRYYPPLMWAALALTADTPFGRLAGILLFVGSSFGALGAVTALTQQWFLGGYTTEVAGYRKAAGRPRGMPAIGVGRKATGEGRDGIPVATASSLAFKLRSPAVAIAVRDHYMLVRTPNHLLTVLTNLLVFPLIIILTTVTGGGQLSALTSGLSGYALDVVTLIILAAHAFIVSGNQVASTCISREGRSFWASKMIPVPPKEQFKGKMVYNLLFAMVQLVILLASSAILLKVDAFHLAVIAVLGALASISVTAICMMNDLVNPKLNWENPHAAMKGNFGTLVAMLFSLAYVVGAGFLVKIMLSAGLSMPIVYVLLAAVLLISGALLTKAASSLAEKRYAEIEV